ncbi:hypothetical protein AS4_43440 [Acinetobacter guillouiae]|nr:hypothetical protein AS4_43440 [Acinetobacter guillouiae]
MNAKYWKKIKITAATIKGMDIIFAMPAIKAETISKKIKYAIFLISRKIKSCISIFNR